MKIIQRFARTAIALTFLLSLHLTAAARLVEDFDQGWRFSKSDSPAAMMPRFDDRQWQAVTLPHDWSSDGPFTAEYGSGNGYAPGGIGWYRKHFPLDALTNKTVTLEFDGVYDHSEVWVNGHFAGRRPFGFSSFQCEVTPFINFGSSNNVAAVRVDHSRFADSRFYTGSGIYRNVRLVVADKLYVAHWGVSITTPKISAEAATVRVETTIRNESAAGEDFSVETDVSGPDGVTVATAKGKPQRAVPEAGAPAQTVRQELAVKKPQLWNVETPNVYSAVTRVVSHDTVVDMVTNTFGIREFHFDAGTGFFLNGKNLKIKGVCLHHDAGPIGAAVPDKVLERRLRVLKEIGANAIRTSHNPPDPALLDLCDRMGFLVMDEAFDEFTPGKNKWVTGRNNGVASHYGYNEIFPQWSVKDMQDLVQRDRNHPSIIMWSIGNEIDYANDPFSHPVLGGNYHPENPRAEQLAACAKPLIAAVKALDTTRPVTAALATVSMSDAVGLGELLDVVGYNYQEMRYADDHQKYPGRILYGSENSHQYNAWLAVRDNPYIPGQFLWTGADYLGEANQWPNRASGAGLLDLCSFKKPLAWFRQSLWSGQPMVYACVADGLGGGRRGFLGAESWNWPTNSTVTVLCFANCPEVTLTLNGKMIGTQTMADATRGVLRWEVPYEPGTLRVAGMADGREVCHYTLQTAGAPAKVRLLPDTTQLEADGKDVCHVEFQIVDAQDVRVPNAAPEVTFELAGPGKILGIGNGDVNSVEDCKSNRHHAFQGRGLVILQAAETGGSITIKANAAGLESASAVLPTQ